MSKINKKSLTEDRRMNKKDRLAGGDGAPAANQAAELQLRRATLACLLWENAAYESGSDIAKNIATLIPQVRAEIVAQIAIECRQKQKLRHTPLFIAREMARHASHRHLVEHVLDNVITRVDQITDFMAIYWKNGKVPLAAGVRRGLANAFNRFNEHNFAKYDRDAPIKLRDVMFMVHPKPRNDDQVRIFNRIAERQLTVPDTWEVRLSQGENKKDVFTDLITNDNIGGLAFLRNLRNMSEAGVSASVIRKGFTNLTRSKNVLLPLNFFSARQAAPTFEREIDQAMMQCYSNIDKLPGHTVVVVDVSGSMGCSISDRSSFNRFDAAAAMASLAAESCEFVTVYATAGSDARRIHKTERVKPLRGFALADEIRKMYSVLGGGGIFTRQCLEYIREDLKNEDVPDRIIIFSDSQDCDQNKVAPAPFGLNNYIIDVSSHKNGINYSGVWTAEISGWSEHFLTYIRTLEGHENNFENSVE